MQRAYTYQKIVTVSIFFIFSLKWLCWYYTHSLSVLSDAVEGFVNLIAGGFSYYSLWLTMQPKDHLHPYGHGKIEFIATSIEGILLFLAGIWLNYSAVCSFFQPIAIHHMDYGIVGLIVLGLLQVGVAYIALGYGKKQRQLILTSSARHMQIDAYTTLAVSGGLIVIYFTSWFWLDGAVALAMGLWVMWNAYKMIRVGVGGIMDESDDQLLSQMIAYLEEKRLPQWIDLHNLRVIRYGRVLHVDCHLTLPWYWTVRMAHDELHRLADIIVQRYGEQIEMFVHTDPCEEELCCRSCTITHCERRKHSYQQRIRWTMENVLKDEKHVL